MGPLERKAPPRAGFLAGPMRLMPGEGRWCAGRPNSRPAIEGGYSAPGNCNQDRFLAGSKPRTVSRRRRLPLMPRPNHSDFTLLSFICRNISFTSVTRSGRCRLPRYSFNATSWRIAISSCLIWLSSAKKARISFDEGFGDLGRQIDGFARHGLEVKIAGVAVLARLPPPAEYQRRSSIASKAASDSRPNPGQTNRPQLKRSHRRHRR
jgi:hypothetical protein